MASPPSFDAVLFDLDGTLVATDRFWVESAERGARRAFEELGLRCALPTPAQWLSLVGLPLEVGFRMLFPALAEEARQRVLAACVEEETALLRAGGAPAMPDAQAVIASLQASGVRLGIASNCERAYLEHMLDALDLRTRVDAAYCRQSPGVHSKSDMLRRLLVDFDTRSAVMVGDRSSDRDAAWDCGIPHVHCAFGFAQGDEAVEAEGRIAALAELVPLLARRGRWITRALERLGAFRPGLRLGVTGGPSSGKSLFARDAARALAARGLAVAAVPLATFAPRAVTSEDPLERVVDLARLERELLRPHEAGSAVRLPAPDLLEQDVVPAGAVLILEGPWLLGARLRAALDRLIHLDLPPTVARRRALGRGLPAEGFEAELALQAQLERRSPPRASADLVLDGTNPLGAEGPVSAPLPAGGLGEVGSAR